MIKAMATWHKATAAALGAAALCLLPVPGVGYQALAANNQAYQGALSADAGGVTYADLADLADPADLVLNATIRKQTEVSPDRAPDLAPGFIRLYIEARVTGRWAKPASARSMAGQPGETVRYLADVRPDAKGRAPRLKGAEVLLFARIVPGRIGEMQLVGRHGQMMASPALEQQLRPVLEELQAPDAPARILKVRDVLWVPGNLAGESEMQLFATTDGEGPALISVVRRPGQAPQWGVSWSELADQLLRPPARNTLVWYRLACFLPPSLPAGSHLSADPIMRDRAEADYRLVMRSLGPCPRNLR